MHGLGQLESALERCEGGQCELLGVRVRPQDTGSAHVDKVFPNVPEYQALRTKAEREWVPQM